MINTEDIDGLTNYYYKRQNVVIPDEWKILQRQNWPKKVMAAMGIAWYGTTRMYVVPELSKW